MQDEIRVLLIDDEQQQFYLVEGYLKQSKTVTFQLDWVSTFEDAIVQIQQASYDICLLDYELGDHNGIDVLRSFREQEIAVPVIVLTSYSSHDIDIAVMTEGAVDFIDKTMVNAHLLDRAIRYTVQQFRHTEALKQSEVRFRAMVEKGSDLIIQLDGNGTVIYSSPSITRILGYPEDAMLQQPLINYVHSDDLPTLAQMLNRLTTVPQDPPIASYRIRSYAGEWRWFESVATNLLRVNGVGAIIINARDITESRHLFQQEQEQRAIAEALLDISNVLNSTLNFDDVLFRILENLDQVVPHLSANLMLIDSNGQTYPASFRGYDHYPTTFSEDDFIFDAYRTPTLRQMIDTCQPLIVYDTLTHPHWDTRNTNILIRSYIGIPIIEEGQVVGFINLDSDTPEHFTEKHAQNLQLFANQAVIAIRNARAFKQAHELAAIEERQRLARELHDAVSQTLFSASVIADSLTRLVDDPSQKLHQGLEKLTELNRSALAEMRALLVELRPQAIVSMPLPELLRNLANGMRGRTSIAVELDVVGNPISLEPEIHLQFYRLAQEILTNAHKHSKAQNIQMELRYLGNSIDLAIADDGVGFAFDETLPPGHHGINIMQERALKIGASISIESAPGEGTYIHIKWPAVLN